MSRRSISKKTTVITSSVRPRDGVAIDKSLLVDNEFDKRPKTDYTYSRSATYSNKYVDGMVISPNLSRRSLYTTEELIREHQAASLMKAKSGTASHVKVYGRGRRSVGGNQNVSTFDTHSNTNNHISYENMMNSRNAGSADTPMSTTRTVQHTVYTNRSQNAVAAETTAAAETANSATLQQNNNNSEAIFSEDESDSVMARSSSRYKSTKVKRTRSRSRSPKRSVRATGSSRRRSARIQEDEVDSEASGVDIRSRNGLSARKSGSYALSSGLDSDTENTLQRMTNKNTRYNAQDLVTERSSTVIETVATGTPIAAKLMGCVLFVYGCTCILFNRLWYSFGQPVYATLQRYLLLDSWFLSRSCTRMLGAIILGLLGLLIPLALLAGGVCSLHALGFVNVSPCGPLTGVYYINKHSDVNTPGISDKLRSMLDDLFTWSETRKSRQPVTTDGASAVDWSAVIDERIALLRSAIDVQSNNEMSMQRQKNTDMQTTLTTLTRDVEDVKLKLSSLTSIIRDLAELKLQVARLSDTVKNIPNHKDAILKLQTDIRTLQIKLGEVDLKDERGAEDIGVLTYLHNEIINLAEVTKYILGVTNEEPKLRSAIQAQGETVVPPTPCPNSRCVCDSDLDAQIASLRLQLMREISEKEKNGGETTVFISSDNSTRMSEQIVERMIREQLNIFAEDQTGMPDFALQSMGAQVVSTRCSQTYYQDTGLMTYFGLPMYHLHKDPSVVIQPGATPGECWCFHGQSGSLVIELAESVEFNSFSLEHISAKQSANGDLITAPKDIEVYGLKSELDTEGKKMGKWRYEKNGPRLQFFPVQDSRAAGFPVVELRVLSNWGKKEFTCLYRFRVHGKLAPK